jgi:D-xylulose reductase
VNCPVGKSIYRPKLAHDVKIAIHTVGICASDVRYYEHGAIGPFVVKELMVLGHEAAGSVAEVGAQVKHLKPGDRVCMERASRTQIVARDGSASTTSIPPCARRQYTNVLPCVIHPAAYTVKLPENVSFAEGAMVEPLACRNRFKRDDYGGLRPEVAVLLGSPRDGGRAFGARLGAVHAAASSCTMLQSAPFSPSGTNQSTTSPRRRS